MPPHHSSLFRLCLEYVGSRIHLIESLVGFPEIVGKEIFDVAVASRQFATLPPTDCRSEIVSPQCREYLQMFFSAYGNGDILHSLSLPNAHLFFSEVIDDCWWLFQHLAHLDLSSCGLGNDHDVLSSLLRGTRLETLILNNNYLSDEGIRKLTVRSRMYSGAPASTVSFMKNLSIAGNEKITARSLDFLKCFTKLELLDISNTSITAEETTVSEHWCALTGIKDKICDCITSRLNIRTKGWAAQLIDRWKCQYDVSKVNTSISCDTERSSTAYSFTSPGSFYSRKRPFSAAAAVHPKVSVTARGDNQLLLVSDLFSCQHVYQSANFEAKSEKTQHQVSKSSVATTLSSRYMAHHSALVASSVDNSPRDYSIGLQAHHALSKEQHTLSDASLPPHFHPSDDGCHTTKYGILTSVRANPHKAGSHVERTCSKKSPLVLQVRRDNKSRDVEQPKHCIDHLFVEEQLPPKCTAQLKCSKCDSKVRCFSEQNSGCNKKYVPHGVPQKRNSSQYMERNDIILDFETDECLISQYSASPPSKKSKKNSRLQQLADWS